MCLPAAIWRLSRPSGAAHWPNRQPSSSWRRQKDRGTRRRARPRVRPRLPATSCFSPSSPGTPGRRHAPPRTSLALSREHSLFPLALSLSHGRALPSPPATFAVATATPSPLRHAQELRLLALKPSAEPRKPERPVEPSPSPSSPPAARDRQQHSGHTSASPSSRTTPSRPP